MLIPTVKKSQEQIEKFMSSNDVVFDDFDTPLSFKSNLLISGKNFKYLFVYLRQMLEFVKNIYLVLNPEVLAQDVLDSIATSKPKIDILASQEIGTSRTQTFGLVSPKIYRILRVDDFHITITLDNSVGNVWDVEGLIVQVKTAFDGLIVQPTIKTFDNKIDIYFHDKISVNYYFIFM